MKRFDAARLTLFVLLALATTALSARVARHYQGGGRLRLEVGRLRVTHLEPATRERLASLASQVSATYYVSGAEHMPSHMRRVERQVTDLLAALSAAVPERFTYRIVDPEGDPELSTFASRRRIAPYRERSVTRDAYSETTIWSSLALSYGAFPEAVIDGIGPEELPRLQATIVARLDQMEEPRAPVFALAAPPGFGELADELSARGGLVPVDLDGGQPFPDQADLLFWMAPRSVTPRALEELERFLASGRSVVVAGSLLAAGPDSLSAVDGGPAIRFHDSGVALDTLYADLGLWAVPGLVCDGRSDELVFDDEPHPAPFLVRCIAPNQNFRLWPSQPNGTLLFTAPTPLALDAEALAARGWNATVLATTSDATWIEEPPLAPGPPRRVDALAPGAGTPVAKQALMVELRPDDPWQGRLVVCAATTPFEDGLLNREHVAHRALVRTLIGELASDQRLVIADADVRRPQPLPPLGTGERIAWRGMGVVLVPLLLLGLALARGALRPGDRRRARRAGGQGRRRGVVPLVVGLAALVLVPTLVARAPLRADVTRDGANRLAPETEAIARRAGEAGTIRAELVFTERQRMPPELRPWRAHLERVLGELERAGGSLELVRTNPDDLDEARRAELVAEGIAPARTVTADEEVTTVRNVWASVRLERDGHVEVVDFPDERAYQAAELRLALALWRLATGRQPHVAFASDVPRLSAAEAHEQFQTQGLFAPMGVDVYSLARQSLERTGFRVTHVNPRAPEVPEDADLLIWMQPRRSVTPMLEATLRHLVAGGRVLLAAQHFVIQSRQYRGADFDLVYWPQPQSPDVEHLYFPEVGIELVREVLFDELSTRVTADTQVTGRRAGRDFERQASALPFLIRTVAANYARGSAFTRGVGDQAFLYGSFLRWDEERLRELGLTATPLITTSERSWTYAWSGGWLPRGVLAGPAAVAAQAPTEAPQAPDAEPPPAWAGRLPLAVLFEGTFPPPEAPLTLNPPSEEQPGEVGPPWPQPAPGRLLFLGGSELFKDARFGDDAFRADHLLTNAVCALALDEELAAVAAHRIVPAGFDWVAPRERLRWRVAVMAAGPLALLLVGLPLGLARRRRPQAPRMAGAAEEKA